MSDDSSVLRARDVICIEVDSLGVLSVPSSLEPLAEREETVSHLRVAVGKQRKDYNRCMFRIETDAGQRPEIKFGSVVQLVHIPTELIVVASDDVDNGYYSEDGGSEKMKTVYLRRSLEGMGELAHKWIVTPRYKLRNDADPLRNNDYVVLRSAQYKNLALTSFPVQSEKFPDCLVGLWDVETSFQRPGFKLVRLLSIRDSKQSGIGKSSGPQTQDQTAVVDFVKGGDYVRLLHREEQGHLICRVDDEKEILSTITPLGSVCRKRMDERDRVHGAFVRPIAMQQPRAQFDFPVSNSPLGIWQIIPVEHFDENRRFNRIPYGGSVRLRHLVTGQYLAIRPFSRKDSSGINNCFYTHNRGKDQRSSVEQVSGREQKEDVVNRALNFEEIDDLQEDNGDYGRGLASFSGGDNESSFRLAIISAAVVRMKHSGWLGKRHSYVNISFGKQYHSRSEICEGKDTAAWNFESKQKDFSFSTTYGELISIPLKFELMNVHNILKDSLVGTATLMMKDVIIAPDNSVLTFHGDFKDKRELYAGSIELKVEVVRTASSSKIVQNPSAIKVEVNTPVSSPPPIIKKKPKNTSKSKAQSADLGNDEEVFKAPGSKWVVATCQEANRYTLFKIDALNKRDDDSGDGDYLTYDDNVILESSATSLRLHLAEIGELLDYNGWWEYSQDTSLVPINFTAGMIPDSDVFHVQRVPLEEVQDAAYASRLMPLARAATSSLQLTPSQDLLFEPLFRHFTNALYSYLLWTLGQAESDGSLLPMDLTIPQLLIDSMHNVRHSDSKSVESEDEDDDAEEDLEDDENEDEEAGSPQSPHANQNLLGHKDKGVGNRHEENDAHILPFTSASRKNRKSSISPWLGRPIRTDDQSPYTFSYLEKYSVKCMSEYYTRKIPLNAKMIRRQGILFEVGLMEQLTQFLNVYFIMQRALSLSQDANIRASYGALAPYLEQCCKAILKLLHGCVFKNEKNALKMISIQGMFLSLVSQRIAGWDTPIESIMEICRGYHDNNTAVSRPGQLSVEEVLIKAIHASDLRQILEQMSWMHSNNMDRAGDILKLLTLLCQSGKASDYFQNILANMLISCAPSSLELSSGGQSSERKSSSMLFLTTFTKGKWSVKFKPQYTIPAQEGRSSVILKQELQREADCLKCLFNAYNASNEGRDDDDDVLDLEECFCLLEDLGYGGPFVYEEMGHLLGVTLWGFLCWWCNRASFYSLSTSVSHNQMSPYHLSQLMKKPIRSKDLMSELSRTPIRRESIMDTLQFWSIISSRIPGYELFTLGDDGDTDAGNTERQSLLPLSAVHPDSQDASHKPSTLFLRQPATQNWIAFDEALSSDCPDHRWLRNSLVLLESVCSGGNLLCQRIVSNLLPPEALLNALSSGSLSDFDRHIICELLVSVYIEVDFVFPTRCFPRAVGNVYCGYQERGSNPAISIGKMFNPISRIRFEGDGSQSGSALRLKLFEFIKAQLPSISLAFVKARGTLLYFNSLLRLLLSLLSRGFFSEEEFYFNRLPTPVSSLQLFKQPLDLAQDFTLMNVELFIVERLNESLDMLRENTALSGVKDAAAVAAAAADFLAKSVTIKRKTFQGFDMVLKKLNMSFEDRDYAGLIDNSIGILGLIHSIKQVSRVQSIWDTCMDGVITYSLEAYSSNIEDLLDLVKDAQIVKKFDSLFKESVDDAVYTQALFRGTLHDYLPLKRHCYDLINKRLSLPLEVAGMLKSMKLVAHPHYSFLKRMLGTYVALAIRHAEEATSSLRNYREYSLHILHFVLDNISGLVLDHFLDQLPSSMNEMQANRFHEDRDKVIRFYLTSGDLPCPPGEDDFFLLDLKKVKEVEDNATRLMSRYSQMASQSVAAYRQKWSFDAVDEMLGLTRRFVGILSNRYTSLGKPGWFKMTDEDRSVFSIIMSFIAMLGSSNHVISDAALPLLEQIIPHLYPYCQGSVKLLHLLLRSSTQASKVDMPLISHFRSRLETVPDDVGMPLKVELYTSLLSSNSTDAIFLATLRLVEVELSEYLRQLLLELSDGNCNNMEHALSCLKLFAHCLARKSIMPRPLQTLWRVLCPEEVVVALLTSDDLPLELKTELACLSIFIYDADDLHIEAYMLSELRGMRMSMYLLFDSQRMHETKLIAHYITSGVLPVLKHRILQSGIVNAFIVNDYIMSEARELESKLINKRVAQNCVDRLARSFPTLLNTPVNKEASSYIPVESLTCLMVMLNVLTFEDGFLYRQLLDDHLEDLIWIVGAMHVILLTRSDFVFDHKKNASIDMKDFAGILKSLQDVLHGLVLERMSVTTEAFFTGVFQEKCLDIVEGKLKSMYDFSSQEKVLFGKQEKVMFKQKMNIAVTYSSQYLKRTSTFKFLRSCAANAGAFFNLGGLKIFEEFNSPQLRSKSFASNFSSYSDFDIWLQGEGKFISILLGHIGDVLYPTQTEYNLLHILCLLLDTNIEEIRSSQLLSQNIKTILVERETQSLHRTQNALLKLGSIRTVIRVLGRLYSSKEVEYTWKYAPLLLRLGADTMSWENREAQDDLVSSILLAVEQLKPPECNCMLGLQELIRKCQVGIMSSVTGDGDREEEQQLNILRASIQIFSFSGALCKGDNTKAQRFLSADGTSSRNLVNISEALCLLLHGILVRLTEMITYISNEQFYDKLAPLIYAQKDSSKRKFLEWHNPRNNIYLFSQFSYALGIAFEECISLCSQDSVSEILQALPKTPALLEFLGLMQLKVGVSVPGNFLLPLKRSIMWKGGDPVSFYQTYLKEMVVSGLLKKIDPEYMEIVSCMEHWDLQRGRKATKFGKARDFVTIFGISPALVKTITRKAEYTCLRLLLSCLEFAEDQQSMDLLSRFNDGILIQNLDSMLQKLRSAKGDEKDVLTSTVVAYVSLIESIGIYYKSSDELLSLWDKESEERGFSPKSIYGSVEIVGADNRLRRLYFPVPTFVKTYWPYPEVQKTKEEIVVKVNRNSPEEKIADFLQQMSRLWIVMRRQERLKLLLTYPIHAIFGGQSLPALQRYIPRQRAIGLYLCIGLNAYFVRTNTYPYTMPERSGYLDYNEWNLSDTVLFSVQLAHLLLMAVFSLRSLLNSSAADDMPALIETESSSLSLFAKLAQFPIVILVLVWDSAFPLFLTALSFFALTGYYWLYVPCLLDIMFQFEDMYFLYVAISKNVVRVGFTCLLAFLCLYFYSIMAYLFFGSQYNFDGYLGCNDPGSCFKLHLDYGLANGPEWDGTGYINPEIDVEFPYSQLFAGIIGTIYNLTYVILINLVLQAVISGLIIDTFSSMREEKEAISQDIYDKCFICSIGRDDFEQAGVSFATHIKEEHNMWHYVWFQVYLKLKDPLSYSSTENYAIRCMKDKQIFVRMMPVNKSLTLEKLKGREDKDNDVSETVLLSQILRRLQLSDMKMSKSLNKISRAQNSVLQTVQQQHEDEEE